MTRHGDPGRARGADAPVADAPPAGAHERVYAVVRRIPAGRVATYGQVAALAGLPGQARLVGYALAALSSESTVPWHRVINARGEVSARRDGPGASVLQRLRLEQEGVRFDAAGRVALDRFGWEPARGARTASPADVPRGRRR